MKLKVGDIFTIPVSDEKTGFGQIINIPNKNNFIIAVFEKVYTGKEWPGLDEIITDRILFLGYTMDAKLYHEHWKIIGNDSSNVSKVKLPYFKLGTPPDMQIINYKGDRLRKASKDEFNSIDYKTVLAPVEYEIALKAHHKLEEWEEGFNELLYEKALESIKIVEKQ
jgi:Immunity protein 26